MLVLLCRSRLSTTLWGNVPYPVLFVRGAQEGKEKQDFYALVCLCFVLFCIREHGVLNLISEYP